MLYEAKNYESLLGIQGFSDEALKTHFKLYEGYVKNTNKLLEIQDSLEKGSPEYNEVKRRFGWEWNGMRLHEYYFSNMSKDAEDIDSQSDLYKKIEENFGSFTKWEEDFRNTGAMRGIGWAVLVYDKEVGKFMNVWINEHDLGHLAGAQPIVIMDVFEHAFVIDFGMNRGEYIDTFMKSIDWKTAEERMK